MKIENRISAITAFMSKVCTPSYMVMMLSGLLGGVSLVLFAVFLYAGLPGQMDLGLDEQTNLYLNALLCFLFFFQHSLMTRKGFRKWISRYILRDYLGSLFSIVSGSFLLILMLFWQKTTFFLVELDGTPYWLMRALFFLSITGFYFTVRSLRPFDPFGINEIISHLKGKTAKKSFFIVRGPYQWVRHPLYLFSLMMIWSQVSVSADRLLFNGLWTFWIITGTFLEERDLITSFGDAYRNYQSKVPMLIPYKWFPWNHYQSQRLKNIKENRNEAE
ncbi:MAG: hypothetical protein HY881_16355 [Deltaproteobacteria bacterium]|nr:hypothetical protein [Deltaproteobacteria bacterium]